MKDVGVRVGVHGEQQYRQSIQNIVQTSKELNAEMKALVSGFDESTSSQEQARQKMDVLNRQIQNQSKYIETLNAKYKAQESTLNTLKQQLDKANAEYGEGSKESQKLTTKIQQQETAMSKTRTAINNATTALNTMQSEMSETERAASGAATQSDRLAEAIDDAGDAAERSKSGWSVLGQMVANFASNAISSALSQLKALAKEAIGVSDSLIKFENTMQFAGFGKDEIAETSAAMKQYADLTVYSLGEVSNVVAQLAANGVDNFEKLVEAAGNLNAAAGGSAETFTTFGLVLTQTAGAGKLTTENWKQLMNAIPGASGKLQEALIQAGAYTGDFAEAMKDGEITAEEFNAAIMKIGSEPIAREAATSVKTFEGAMGRLKTTAIDALTNIYNTVGGENVSAFIVMASDLVGGLIGLVGKLLTPILKIPGAILGAKNRLDEFTKSSKDLTSAVDQYKTTQEQMDKEYDIAQGVIDNYKSRLARLSYEMKLARATGKDATDAQKEYSAIIDVLNSNIPGLNLEINEMTGLLTANSQKILDNADAWAQSRKEQIWQEQFTDILNKQAQAEVELETNRVRLKVATDDYNKSTKRAAELEQELSRLWDEYYSGTAPNMDDLNAKIKQTTTAWEEETAKVGDAQTRMNNYTEAVGRCETAMESVNGDVAEAKAVLDNLNSSQKQAAEEVAPAQVEALEDVQEAVDETAEKYHELYMQTASSVKGTMGLFNTMSYEMDITLDDMIAALDSQVQYMQDYTDNLQYVIEAGLNQGLVDILSDGSVQSAKYLQAIAEEGEDGVRRLNEAWASTKDEKDDFIRMLADMMAEAQGVYAKGAQDASAAWNRNLSLRAYNPNKASFTTISAYKTGLAYVPYDGFIAELHKGERILTAAEALEYRNLRTPEVTVPAAPVTPDLSTINNTNKTSVVLNVYGAEGQDEQALADIVMDRIQRSVNRQEALYA